MTKDQIDENNSGETPEVEGQTEAGSEPETGEDVTTEVPPASGDDVAEATGTGEDIGESSEPADTDTDAGAEAPVPSEAKDTESGSDDLPADAAGEEDVGESSEPADTDTDAGAEAPVPSEAKDTESGSDDLPADAAGEASSQSGKSWYLQTYKKLVAGLVLVREHKKVVAGLVFAREHKKLVAGLVLVLFISFVVYGLKHWRMHPGGDHKEIAAVRIYRAPITMEDSGGILDLAAFVVLFPENRDRTYLSLSISLRLSNSNIYKEIEEKKTILRGIIYGVLDKAVKTVSPQIMSKEQMKQDIISALNDSLVAGTIDGVYFTKFLVI